MATQDKVQAQSPVNALSSFSITSRREIYSTIAAQAIKRGGT
jgi:hypothetical protein